MFQKAETSAHDIAGDLRAHVESFHAGLDAFRDRLLKRHDVVEARLQSLEHEHAVIEDGLDHVDHLKGA